MPHHTYPGYAARTGSGLGGTATTRSTMSNVRGGASACESRCRVVYPRGRAGPCGQRGIRRRHTSHVENDFLSKTLCPLGDSRESDFAETAGHTTLGHGGEKSDRKPRNEASQPVHCRSVHRCGLVGCDQMSWEISDAWGNIIGARLGCYPNRRRVPREGASRTPHLLCVPRP